MKKFILLSFVMIFCYNLRVISQADRRFKADVALDFINSYKRFCDKPHEQKIVTKWIINNSLLTDTFKSEYKKTMEDAYKAEPELGLDFDPIIDAQDFPEQGYKIIKSDSISGFVTLAGIDIADYTVTFKIAFSNNRWLIDGAGIINIPKK